MRLWRIGHFVDLAEAGKKLIQSLLNTLPAREIAGGQCAMRRLDRPGGAFDSMHSYSIQRVRGGAFRAQVAAYIAANHYSRSAGGSGQLFAVLRGQEVAGAVLIGGTVSANQSRSIVAGAVLVGPTASRDAERSIVAAGVLVT